MLKTFSKALNQQMSRRVSLYSSQRTDCLGAVVKKVKVAHTRLPSVWFRSWSRFLTVSLQVTWVTNPAVGCHYFPPGLQLPPQPLRGLLPVFAAWWTDTMGVNSLPKTVTRQRRACDLNPGPSAPESSTLTTRLPSHPRWSRHRSLPQSRQIFETAAADAVVCACSTRKPIVPTAFGRRRAVSEYRRIKNHQNLSLRPSINNVNFTGCSCTWHRRSILMQKFLIVLSCSR